MTRKQTPLKIKSEKGGEIKFEGATYHLKPGTYRITEDGMYQVKRYDFMFLAFLIGTLVGLLAGRM